MFRAFPQVRFDPSAWEACLYPPENLDRLSLASDDRRSYEKLTDSQPTPEPLLLRSAVYHDRRLIVSLGSRFDPHRGIYEPIGRGFASRAAFLTARSATDSSARIWIHTRKADRGYFHFVADHLQALKHAQERGWLSSPFLIPDVSPRYRQWVEHFFAIYGVDLEWFDATTATRLPDLTVLMSPATSGHFDPGLVSRIRSRIAGDARTDGRRRIFVTRRHNRRIRNLQEITPILQHYSIEIVDFDVMPVPQQVELSAESELLIGPHGAGLVNQWWMPQSSTVIELIRPSPWNNACFWRLACSLGHRYHAVSTTRVDSPSGERSIKELRNGDLVVNPTMLRMELEHALRGG